MDTLSALKYLASHNTVRAVLALAVAAGGAVWAWAGGQCTVSFARQAEVRSLQEQIEESQKRFESELAAASQRCSDDIRAQYERHLAVAKLVQNHDADRRRLWAHFVRMWAADLEGDPRTRAQRANKAENAYDRHVAAGMDPYEAALKALRSMPGR